MFGIGASHDLTHNISKNWTQRIYRFGDITDLGFSHLYFSCKNYQELAPAKITKVVGYFTTHPTKFVLHFSYFSMIFYAIYKNQQTHFTILVALFQGGPQKDLGFCNVAPGRPGSGGPAKFRRSAAGLGQGRAWGGARDHWGAIWGLGRGRERAGEGRRRRQGLVAAAACRAGGVIGLRGRRRVGELMQVQGKVAKVFIWTSSRPALEFTAAAIHGTAAARP
jgi:hypothetical protein